jgi:Tfp pilus assembly ATPase PilU
LDDTFNGNPTIHLNRQDLFDASLNLKDFVFKVLMWGYPTKGRGNNIENMLTENVLSDLIKPCKDIGKKRFRFNNYVPILKE